MFTTTLRRRCDLIPVLQTRKLSQTEVKGLARVQTGTKFLGSELNSDHPDSKSSARNSPRTIAEKRPGQTQSLPERYQKLEGPREVATQRPCRGCTASPPPGSVTQLNPRLNRALCQPMSDAHWGAYPERALPGNPIKRLRGSGLHISGSAQYQERRQHGALCR